MWPLTVIRPVVFTTKYGRQLSGPSFNRSAGGRTGVACITLTDWTSASRLLVRPTSANALIIWALSIGCRDHSQSKMRSRIRDHRHCDILMAQCKLYTLAAAVAVNKERSPMGRWGRCSIYRHRFFIDTTTRNE